MLTKREAYKRLANRWLEQVEKYPNMVKEVPLRRYQLVNWRHVAKHESLKEYRAG